MSFPMGSLSLLFVVGTSLVLLSTDAAAASTQLHMTPTGDGGGQSYGDDASGAGDFNGDGYPDMIVGAPENGLSGVEAGRAYIFFGGPQADDQYDLAIESDGAGLRVGGALAGIGDVNGDGFDDVISGMYTYGGHGRAYIYFGGAIPDNVPDLTIDGAAGDALGISVAKAGDVNGDGHDDFIVGATGAGGSDEGQALVYFGGPGVDSTPDRTYTGVPGGENFGRHVGSAGDINGDGYSDIIVGDNGLGAFAYGQVSVFFGGPSADTVADLVFNGAANFELLGSSVGTAGDMNGDGFDDMLVGKYGYDNDRGQVYVYFGGISADTIPDLTFTGEAEESQFGFSAASAGDVNSDGFDDVIVGAQGYDAGATNAGRAYVYLGGSNPDLLPDIILDGPGFRFGRVVDGLGDVDGDGFDDLLISGAGAAGEAFVYSVFPYRILSPNGGERWAAGTSRAVRWLGHDLADLSLSVDGGFSWSTLLVGVGGDELNEARVLVPDTPTSSALIRLTYSGQSPTHSNSDDSDHGFEIFDAGRGPMAHALRFSTPGEGADDRFGGPVERAGDVNSDGYEDFIVGAQLNDAAGLNAGRAYVFFGGPDADDTPDLTLTGELAGDSFGGAAAAAGDINGDGHDDFLISAPFYDTANGNGGRVYLYYGGPGVDGVPDVIYQSEAGNYRLGYGVAGVGDVNADGYDDIIASGNFAGPGQEGRANVYYGGSPPDTTADILLIGEAALDQFGFAPVGGFDINADGIDDYAVSAPHHDAAANGAGRAYVYLGAPQLNLFEDPNWIIDGEANNDAFGRDMAAGDVNGDGLDDLIVTAWSHNGTASDAGRVYVYFGGPEFNTSADLILDGEAASDRFGVGVDVGDVNGDGVGDIVVGAYQHDFEGQSTGRVYVFHGGPGLDSVPDFFMTGEEAGDWFGIDVAVADVGGDGFGDIVVGADDGGSGGSEPGQVYLFDCNRYIVTSPSGGDTWNVGAAQSIDWLGAEPADVWLSVDGGNIYSLLESGVGGSDSNVLGLTVPHQPTRFAKIRVTPSDAGISGSADSDSLFTIEASIAMLMLSAQPGKGGGVLLSWKTDPGPGDLSGYKVDRSRDGRVWDTLMPLTRETSYLDNSGTPGMQYRLIAINGLGQEFLLGETTLSAQVALAAWPLPYRTGDLSISFATYGGRGGGVGSAEVAVFDLNGRLVKTIASGDYSAGVQVVAWDGRDRTGRGVASGVYFLRAVSAGESSQIRLVVVR